MGDFKRQGGFGNKNRGGFGGRDGGRPGFGNRPSFGGRDRDERRSEMFPATCDSCHRQCEVPFRPNGSKPVYCDNCFSSKRDGHEGPQRRMQQEDKFTFGAPEVKHAPTVTQNDKRIDELRKQVDLLNAKVDKLLNIAQHGSQPKAAAGPVTATKATAPVKTVVPEVHTTRELQVKTVPTTKDKKPAKKAATPAASTAKKEAKKKVPAKKK